jgi:iodotyrosine deiodinase
VSDGGRDGGPEPGGAADDGHESMRDALARRRKPFVPLDFERLDPAESLRRAQAFHDRMQRRRTTRHFSTEPVPREWIELAIRAAGSAPSGAHQQPWTFVAVSDPATKAAIRAAAEEEERAFYSGRAPAEWLEALAPLGTDEHKPHLTDAPWVVVLFRHAHGVAPDGSKRTFYYTHESCGIAAGFFIAAVHQMGLVTLTHTPNPMAFLAELLGRPAHERAMLVMPVGYPAPDAHVPDLQRKPLGEIADFR